MRSKLRVALVHDLIGGLGGGSELVLLELHRLFPEAPIYTTLFNPSRLRERFAGIEIRTSFLQRFARLGPHYEFVVPMMPLAFENFDLRGYDLIVSSCYACSKGVITPADAQHVCYCYTPMRWVWSHQEDYIAQVRAPFRPVTRLVFARLRRWDYLAAQRVDSYIAISQTVQQRIAKFYRRPSDVVHAPVDLDRFRSNGQLLDHNGPYLVVSRFFPYKRVEVAVQACTELKLPLTVIGDGPQLGRIRRMAGPTVRFLGEVNDATLRSAYQAARALIFTSDEDFGLVPLESMAVGRPVLALNKGGATETVIPGVTGELYDDSGVPSLVDALQRFRPADYDPAACRARAEEFSPANFRRDVQAIIEREIGRAI